jgi:rhomboid protease GluP
MHTDSAPRSTQEPKELAARLRALAIEQLNSDIAPSIFAGEPRPLGTNPERKASNADSDLDASVKNASAVHLPEDYHEIFHPSEKSELGKVRRWLWLGAFLSVVIVMAGSKGSISATTISLTLLITGSIYWYLGRQLKTDKASVTLSSEGIESSLFTGKIKRYPWRDITGISVENNQGVKRILFHLAESQGYVNKRDFWTGINYARPAIPLAAFEPAVQEKLFGALSRCVTQSGCGNEGDAQTVLNPLSEEREFQERLKTFAPIPWATYTLIAVNVLVWAITVLNGAAVLKAPADKLLLWGGNAASEVQRGEWWRLLTATFLHSGLMHIAMNMVGLASAGITVERIYGHRLFLLIYLGAGLIGSALSLHFSAQNAVSVGASGAVFGVTGALLIGFYQHREQLPKTIGKQTLSSMGFFIIYSLMQGFAHQGIDNAAHVGGLLGGCLLAFVLPERFDMSHFVRTFNRRAVAGIAIVLIATASLAALAPPAAIDQKKVFEGNIALLNALNGFDQAFKSLQQEHKDVQAGKMTERQSDDRSRTVHAPMFHKVLQGFRQVYLAPSDPRLPIYKETMRMTELILESLEMQSVYQEGSDKPEPIDPARMAAIQEELKQIDGRLTKLLQDANNKPKR